ncbi:magnesium-translocating P-type ATPase [Hyphomicrobium sp. DMF-1]|jgi:Mg2+-importing ATPase|uniref:magnesium-translocating P-type ATPase n=1 Tax=Hyphomicrobium sp. DMF-1 TaxID=3019544 RepID=UPI0022EBECAB|nr:magnesium-translocating P-type ATPase [Hyphomicrobium sp. DMF-1]WBT40110.1 magnesium-translocating P-type ATPase [Hyphomicrobium sp. DMF-1]
MPGTPPPRFWQSPIETLPGPQPWSRGLTQAEASERYEKFGPNDVLAERARPLWRAVVDRFSNPLILILLFASALSAWTGDVLSFAIIVAIVLLSVVLDVVQQRRAENAVDALRRSVGLKATVVRDGTEAELPVERLVPGDVVRLSAGDIVPADCRLLEAASLYVNQSLLTGEPYPVAKDAAATATSGSPAEALNAVFAGTSVISGSATALVCETGRRTELGAVARSLTARRPRDAFERGIQDFGLLMMRLTIFLVLFVLAANTLFDRPWLESLIFALALAVGLTPELLPMVFTVTLANGARRLAERRVIVKRLASIHDLGAMDVLCTDKTGTLTQADVAVAHHVDAEGTPSARVFELAYLNSTLASGIASPLDRAVVAHENLPDSGWSKVDECPFDFERRRVSVLLEKNGDRLLVVKGAPEDILSLSTRLEQANGATGPMDEAWARRLTGEFERLGEDGYRVLAVAVRNLGPSERDARAAERDLTFAGFLAFVDPPKPDAANAIRELKKAGVTVKILTGDNERITQHICRELDIEVTGLLTGTEIDGLSDEALRARLPSTTIFCRVLPQQKARILAALKHAGHVAGFLGDGINDASALNVADVGISVDTAADVAKEAADMVLLDRNLDVVLEGVREGRRTVENVTKYILMGSSSNLGNMVSMAGAALFLPFLPMLPTQVLLNNLLYDLSEVGVPFDRVDPETVSRPIRWDLGLIKRVMLILGPLSSLFDFFTFWALLTLFGGNEQIFQSGWFVESLATQTLVVLVIRTHRRPWKSRPHILLASLSIGVALAGVLIPFTPLGTLFGLVPLPPLFYALLVATVAVYLASVEFVKRAIYAQTARVS